MNLALRLLRANDLSGGVVHDRDNHAHWYCVQALGWPPGSIAPRCCHSVRAGSHSSNANGSGGSTAMRAILGIVGFILLLSLGAEPSKAQSTPQQANSNYS